jgi:hypothetical protein
MHDPPTKRVTKKKGSLQMSINSIRRTMLAISAALAVSTVTVGAAVAPAYAVATPAAVAINA